MVTKASLIIEYDGATCAVLLNDMDLNLLVNSIACLNGKGKLQAIKLDDSFRWETLKNLTTTSTGQSTIAG